MYRVPTKEEILNASNKTVPDIIDYSLKVLFCGINPGLYTAAVGYHYGRPGNRFWKALYLSGFTPRLFKPSDCFDALKFGFGLTNVVPRATKSEAELTKQEFIEGGKMLMEKVKKYKPKWLAVVGIGAYRLAFNKPGAGVGEQEEKIGGTGIWVLPSPSGLNANYNLENLAELFAQFKKRLGS